MTGTTDRSLLLVDLAGTASIARYVSELIEVTAPTIHLNVTAPLGVFIPPTPAAEISGREATYVIFDEIEALERHQAEFTPNNRAARRADAARRRKAGNARSDIR
jgi:hypothetical protein